tara:strand:- start:230 stop:448 length:219 start_codon:yes stop_codon:yes gene_type:complete
MNMSISKAKDVMKRACQGKASDAEIGAVLLFLEKEDLRLFGAHPSGKRLLNKTNPHVRRMVKAANQKKGFGS